MSVELKDLLEFIKATAWPLVVGLALWGFRIPLCEFLSGLGQRVTKLSAFHISVDLATLPTSPRPWADPAIFESANLPGGVVTTTTIMGLFNRIRDEARWDYLVVDIATGKRWLMSRLFIYTVILQNVRGLRAVVFVESRYGMDQRVLGIASADRVRWALAGRYSWFATALTKALEGQMLVSPLEPLPTAMAESVVNRFMEDSEIRQTKEPQRSEEWEQLRDQPVWEHTKWLDTERLNRDLKAVFYDTALSQLTDSPDIPARKRGEALLRRRVPFVALVNKDGEFKGLVDRQILLEQVGARLAELSDERETGAKRSEPGATP
jgi:hypothetical protein